MSEIFRPHQPERAVLYRVLFPHFEKFVAEYEERFERTYGYFRPIVKDMTAGHHEARRAVVIRPNGSS